MVICSDGGRGFYVTIFLLSAGAFCSTIPFLGGILDPRASRFSTLFAHHVTIRNEGSWIENAR